MPCIELRDSRKANTMATRIPLGSITQDLADFRRAIEPFFSEPRRLATAPATSPVLASTVNGSPRQEGPVDGGRSILPIDVFTRGDDVVVVSAIPGIDPEEITISVEKNVVTISGSDAHAGESEEIEHSTWLLREIPRGSFKRSLQLPFDVDADRAEATFDNGMLQLTLPKRESAKPRTIVVKPGSGMNFNPTSGTASGVGNSNSISDVDADAIEVKAKAEATAAQEPGRQTRASLASLPNNANNRLAEAG